MWKVTMFVYILLHLTICRIWNIITLLTTFIIYDKFHIDFSLICDIQGKAMNYYINIGFSLGNIFKPLLSSAEQLISILRYCNIIWEVFLRLYHLRMKSFWSMPWRIQISFIFLCLDCASILTSCRFSSHHHFFSVTIMDTDVK